MILRIRAVQIVRVIIDHSTGEQIDAEESVLPAKIQGIKGARVVVPAKMSDESLISIGEFLTANLQ